MLTLSPYRLRIFRQCPRRYKYHYLDGLYAQYRRWWPFYTMGAHVHTALCYFLHPLNRDRSFGRLEGYLKDAWPRQRRGFAGPEEERIYYQRARAQLRWFHAHEDVEARPLMIEALHSTPLGAGLKLSGKVDRVDKEPDGRLRVIDYKTSKSRAAADDFQLRAYALLLERRYRLRVSEVAYLFLSGDGWVGVVPSPELLARTEAELFAAQVEIEAEQAFAPRPNRFCGWCDFQAMCEVELAPECGDWEENDFDFPD